MTCCPICRDPLPDLDTISVEEGLRRQLAYQKERSRHRDRFPAITRKDIEGRLAR